MLVVRILFALIVVLIGLAILAGIPYFILKFICDKFVKNKTLYNIILWGGTALIAAINLLMCWLTMASSFKQVLN
jgi:hypothetical protein